MLKKEKTMYCSNCGKEISSDQRFCCHCAAENRNYVGNAENSLVENKSATQIQRVTQQNSTFDRNVLVNYLFDIQALHFAKRKTEEEKEKLKKKIDALGIPRHIKPAKEYSEYTGVGIALLVSGFGAFIPLILLVANGLNSGTLISPMSVPGLSVITILSAIIFVFAIVWMIYDHITDRRRYEEEARCEEKRMGEEINQKNGLMEYLIYWKVI